MLHPVTPVTSHLNTLSHDVEIKGTVSFEGSLFSDGTIEGDVLSSGSLSIGENGSVKGDISAATVSVHGRIEGDVSVSERCELKGNAELIGDLQAPRLIMEEGATFIGQCKVGPRSGEGASGDKADRPPAGPAAKRH